MTASKFATLHCVGGAHDEKSATPAAPDLYCRFESVSTKSCGGGFVPSASATHTVSCLYPVSVQCKSSLD